MARKKPTQWEHREAVALFQHLETIENKHFIIRRIYRADGGQHHGRRGAAGYAKGEGVKPGTPDVCVPYRREWTFPGGIRSTVGALYIELKRPAVPHLGVTKGTVSKVQRMCHDDFRQAGQLVFVCYGWQQAAEAIHEYLGIEGVKIQ